MKLIKISAVALAIAALGTSAMAQSPVGTWHGHLQITLPPMPANTPPQQKEMIAKMMATFQKMVIVLNLKADKTYVTSTQGGPGPSGKSEKGTWSQSGKKVTLKTTRKMAGQPNEVSGEVSKDNKTFTLVLPTQPGQPGGAKVVFTRG